MADAPTIDVRIVGMPLVNIGVLAVRWALLSDEIEAVREARALTFCTEIAKVDFGLGPEALSYEMSDPTRTPCWKTQWVETGGDPMYEDAVEKQRHRSPMCAECARFVDISDHRRALVRQRAAIQGAIRRAARRIDQFRKN